MNRPQLLVGIAALVLGLHHATAGGNGSDCDGLGCDACDGQVCCDQLESNRCCGAGGWMASVDALFLHRSDPSSGVLVFNTADPSQNLNANNFDFDTETGVDVSLTRAFGKDNALELRYFGVDDWDASLSTTTTANELLQFNAAVPVFTLAGDAINASYTSELHNAEINLSHQVRDWLALGVGFRYVDLEERASGSLVNAIVPFDYSAVTRNRLYGAQIGMQALLWCNDLFQVDTIGKAGIYGNHAQHNALINTSTTGIPLNGSDDPAAFVGEIGINAATFLTDHLSLRGGYRLLWLDGVALASDQLAASDFFTASGIDASGDVFYQGAFVGLEFTR